MTKSSYISAHLGPIFFLLATSTTAVAQIDGGHADLVDTSIPAVPNAVEIVQDTQNVNFWSRYQRGTKDGWRYTLFPDGTATVLRGARGATLKLSLDCATRTSCSVRGSDGSILFVIAASEPVSKQDRVEDGERLAAYLAYWILKNQRRDDREEPNITPAQIATVAPERPRLRPERQPKPARLLPGPTLREKKPPLRTAKATPRSQQTFSPVVTNVKATALPPPKQTTPPSLVERLKLNCSITGSVSLSFDNRADGGSRPGKPRASLGCNAKLSDRLALSFSLVGYPISKHKRDWDPDYTYAVSYRINDKLSLSYSNYSGRFDSTSGGIASGLTSGNLRAIYKLPRIELPNGRAVACSAGLGLPDPRDQSASLSCGYSITDKFRIGATAHLYAPGWQGEFDPDYSYTASYRVSDDWLISYSNYSNNRWPWNRGKSPGPGILGGSISFNYKLRF